MLRITHELRCFLWRQNNPEVNYFPTRISGGEGGVFLEEVSRSRKRNRDILLGPWNVRNLRWIFRKLEGVVGTGWSWLMIGTGGGHLWVQ
jgi:hypothetical protein